jgi:ABC-type uncharacterized transport system involved in gliding motility auxiliary subunit
VVSTLSERLRVTVLFSENLPPEHARVRRYLMDLLDEYDFYGNKYFTYKVVDQDRLEKAAAEYGIRPVTSRELVSDQVSFRKVYMGMILQHADLVERIDAVTEPDGLEYEITSRIESMKARIDSLVEMRESKEAIRVTLYMDDILAGLPIQGIGDLQQRVKDAVEKANKNNYGRLVFRHVSPSDRENADEIAEEYGLNRLQWKGGQTARGGAIEPGSGVLGVVVSWKERHATIPLQVQSTALGNVIVGLDRLQENINQAVDSVINVNQKVAYLTGHGEADLQDDRSPEGGAIFREILSDGYEITPVDLSKDDIPADVSLLIVNGPRQKIPDYELYKIDQFLMRGNSLLLFSDSFREIRIPGRQNMLRQGRPMVVPLNTGMEEMVAGYGLSIGKSVVLDENCAQANMGNMIRDYYLAPKIDEEGLSEQSVVTRYLRGLVMLKVSPVNLPDEKREKTRYLSLVESSDQSWTMSGRVSFNPMMMSPPSDDTRRASHTLAALAEGKLPSHFAGREIPEKPVKEEGEGNVSSRSPGGITSTSRLDATVDRGVSRIIVVGTSEVARSRFIISSRDILAGPAGGGRGMNFPNSLFLHNMVDYLTGNVHVPEMRGKGLEYNPLEKTGELNRRMIKVLNMAGVPLLVVLWGLVMWQFRKRYRARIEERYSTIKKIDRGGQA